MTNIEGARRIIKSKKISCDFPIDKIIRDTFPDLTDFGLQTLRFEIDKELQKRNQEINNNTKKI